jgi:hypothetical protein
VETREASRIAQSMIYRLLDDDRRLNGALFAKEAFFEA